MTDISVIILTGNEQLHIARCLERLAPLEPREVFIIESQKGDATHEIATKTARKLGWQVCAEDTKESSTSVQPSTFNLHSPTTTLNLLWHAWPGLYAKQFNWALDNVAGRRLKVEGGTEDVDLPSWILRLDADEYLTSETIERIKAQLPTMPEDVTGLILNLKRKFCGGEIRHATTGIRLLRIWRTGVGRSEEREMDEHIELSRGQAIEFDGAFYDDNLNNMDWWREKHRGYAKREAKDALAFERGEVRFKRSKELYYKMPRYLRAFVYFGIRYFLEGGFLDGYAGWMWNFWQGLWYRLLVDRTIGELKSH